MILKSILSLACCHQDATQQLVSVARECYDLSESTTQLCNDAQTKNASMMSTSQDICTEMRGLKDSEIDANIFVKVKKLIENSKSAHLVSYLDEIGNAATQIRSKGETMSQSLQRGIESLPDGVKDAYDSEDTTSYSALDNQSGENRTLDRGVDQMGAEERDMLKLLNVEQDVTDLETTCSRSTQSGGLDLFSASTTGSAIYEQATSKGQVCQSLLNQMHTLCNTIGKLMKTLLVDNCCVQAIAIATSIGNLFRCRNLVRLLIRAADAIKKLIKAIGKLAAQAWKRIQNFMNEFDAAKKIGRFVSDVKQSKVGKMAGGLVSTFLKPGSAGTSRS
jgi:hypothetical protein